MPFIGIFPNYVSELFLVRVDFDNAWHSRNMHYDLDTWSLVIEPHNELEFVRSCWILYTNFMFLIFLKRRVEK